MSQPPGNTTDTKHYKVIMGIKARLTDGAKSVKGASVSFSMDIKYDSDGKPIEAHRTSEKSEISTSEKVGVDGDYESLDAENVCCFVGSALMLVAHVHGRSAGNLIMTSFLLAPAHLHISFQETRSGRTDNVQAPRCS